MCFPFCQDLPATSRQGILAFAGGGPQPYDSDRAGMLEDRLGRACLKKDWGRPDSLDLRDGSLFVDTEF